MAKEKEEKILEGEVRDMEDLKTRKNAGKGTGGPCDGSSSASSKSSSNGSFGGNGTPKGSRGSSVAWKALSVFVMMLAVAYDLSPIDAIPDGVPLLGLLDDVVFTLMALLNLYQHFSKKQDSPLLKFVRYIKWTLVALVVMAAVMVGGLITLIVHLVT